MSGDREICDICQQTYSKKSNLLQHMRRVHFGIKINAKASLLQCETCDKVLSSRRSYVEHQNSHLNSRPHTCHLCPYAACSQMTLKRHVLRKHSDKSSWSYLCLYCGQRFMEPTRYQTHIKAKHPNCSGTFICDACEFGTLAASVFEDHLGRHERGEILNTDGTPNSFSRQPLLSYLVRTGGDDWPFAQLKSIDSLNSSPEFGAQVVLSSTGISPLGRPVVTIKRAKDISVLKITEEIVPSVPKPIRPDHVYDEKPTKTVAKRPKRAEKKVVKRRKRLEKPILEPISNSPDNLDSTTESAEDLALLVKDVQELINASFFPQADSQQPVRQLLEPELD